MNTDLSVPELISKKKGVLVFIFIFCDLLFAVFQLLPYMGILPFIFLYAFPYLFTFIFFCLASLRNPGFKKKRTGKHLLKMLTSEYQTKNNQGFGESKIKNLSAKFCYQCNIVKGEFWIDLISGRARHCEICDRCVYKYDHHCSYILNCVGKKNIKIFLIFLISTSLFLVLRLFLNFFASIGLLCWNHKEIHHSSTKTCEYDFEVLGEIGQVLRNSYLKKGGLYITLMLLNWVQILFNLASALLIILLLKITFKNVWQGTTTYERHLNKMAKKDTTLRRELRENFLNDEQN